MHSNSNVVLRFFLKTRKYFLINYYEDYLTFGCHIFWRFFQVLVKLIVWWLKMFWSTEKQWHSLVRCSQQYHTRELIKYWHGVIKNIYLLTRKLLFTLFLWRKERFITHIKRRNDGDVESTMEMLLAISSHEERFLPLFDPAAKEESQHRHGRTFSRSLQPPTYREALQCPSMHRCNDGGDVCHSWINSVIVYDLLS